MSRIFLHFSLFVALSLLLHLGVFSYFATRGKETIRPEITPAPFFVDLREAEKKPREFVVPLRQPTTTRTQPARKLAESDQAAPREEAPKGRDSRETTTVPPAPDQQKAPRTTPPLVSESGKVPALNLLTAAEKAAQSVANLDPEITQKMRRDVEEGRAVLLDTEKDILGSFYTRFRSAVENVWDYPKDAIARGEAGVCLYRIEINRAGVLVNEPELLESSGFDRLDAEAKEAVLKASPLFGFLPDAYRYETLTIFAYFDYRLGNRPRVRDVYYYR